jgi:iron complex outermembrane receptor protein
LLEDIERIEVLRGSNSAYGANAFLGVVNIITRNAADTHGAMLSATVGDKGVNDNAARVGWGNEKASFRFTGSRRVDRGFNGVYDDTHVSRLQFRGDFVPTPVMKSWCSSAPARFRAAKAPEWAAIHSAPLAIRMHTCKLRWQRQLAPDEQFQVALTFMSGNIRGIGSSRPRGGISAVS